MFLLILSTIMSTTVAVYAWQHRRQASMRSLFHLAIVLCWWSTTYILSLSTTDMNVKLFWFKVRFLAVAVVPVGWFFLALAFAGYTQWLTRFHVLLLSTIPISIVFVGWINEMWIWHQLELVPFKGYMVLAPTYGVGFWLHFYYSILLLVIGSILILRAAVLHAGSYWQTFVLFVATLLPWMTSYLVAFDLNRIDPSPFFFMASAGLIGWAILRFSLLDITHIDQNLVVETLPDMVIVLNNDDQIVDINKAACTFVNQTYHQLLGHSIAEIFAQWGQDFQHYLNNQGTNVIIHIADDDKVRDVELIISTIKQGKWVCGRLLFLHDVTDYRRVDIAYQETVKQLQARTHELETLHQMGLDLANTLNLDKVLEAIMGAATNLLEVESGALFLYQSQRDSLKLVAGFHNPLPIDYELKPGEGLAGKVWQLCEPLVIDSYQQWQGRIVDIERVIGERSSIGIPIGYGSEKTGVLAVAAQDGRRYTYHDVELLNLFIPGAALAIRNAQLYEQMQTELAQRRQTTAALHRQNQYLAALHQVALDLLNHRQEGSLLQSIVERAADLFGAAYGGLTLAAGRDIIIRATTHEEMDKIGAIVDDRQGTLGQVYTTGEPLVINDYADWHGRRFSLDGLQLQTAVIVPIVKDERCIGTLGLARTDATQIFDPEEVYLLTLFAQVAALVLQQTQLYEAAQHELAERERIQSDLQQSEERYRDLFDKASDLIQSVDADGRFLYVNQRWLDTLGYTADEVAQMHFAEVIHPNHLQHCYDVFRRLQTTEPSLKIETVFISKKGHHFIVEGYLNAQFENGRFVATRGFFRDISERKQAEDDLRESEERLRAIIASMDDLVFVLDRQGIYLDYYQPKHRGGLYVAPEQFLGKSYDEILPQSVADGVTAVLQKVTQYGQVEKLEYALMIDGQEQWFSANISGRNDRYGQFDGFTIVARNITDYKETAEQLRQIALFDGLTGLPNRRLLMERLAKAIQQKHQYCFALLFLDLDRFKIINDSLGHQVGDALLIAIARLLESCVRQHDTVARLGGDEFVVLLTQIHHDVEAQRVSERILERMAQPFFLRGHTIHTSASIGLISQIDHYDHPDEVLRHADIAMYQAKKGGKARYELFDLSQQTLASDLWQIENDLRRALEKDELIVYYQPIVSLGNGRLTSIEALVRWRHPQRGLLDPGVFLSVAEEAGLIVAVNQWVLQKACHQLQMWHQAGYDTLRLTVNISAVQLQQDNAVPFIHDTLAQSNLSTHSLGLEITERFSARTKELIPTLHDLRDQGLGLLIDDFGIGSSLESLKLFPLDYLKINQTFVQGMTSDAHDRAIITAIIAMAHSLDLKVIAEGVETAEQLAHLQAEGCDEVQGYFIGMPMSAADMSQWIRQKAHRALDIDSPSKSLDIKIRAHFAENMGYALLDKELAILKSNDTMRQWIMGHLDKPEDQLVTDAFPVLIGLEESMQELISNTRAEPLVLSRIFCPGADEHGRYYNLRVEPFAVDTAVLLLIVQDVTREAQQEFVLRQQLNELRLVRKT